MVWLYRWGQDRERDECGGIGRRLQAISPHHRQRHDSTEKVLDERSLGYSVVSEKEADLYDMISISELTHALDAENCAILSVSQQSESLENYFVSLVGGESHA